MQELRRIFHRRRAAEAEAADSSPATDRGRRPGARAEHRAWRQRSVPRVRPEHARHRDRASGSVQKMTDVADRRKHARIALKGTAILLAGEYAVRSRLANLSTGGFLARTLVTPPLRQLGRSVDIELRLGESSFEPDVIAVADSIPAVTANEMREFVGRNHPRVKLVSITDVIDPDINIFQLPPEDLRGNLADAIRRVLGRPRTPSLG